ncbi:MAG: tyrosine-type recombinase/integrase, partial [Nitrospiraceae bacterium]
QVNVARSYLAAAFSFGAKSDNDPRTLAKDGVLFGLKSNPVSLVPRIKEYERTRERNLDERELAACWKALDALPLVQRQTLRFNLALACQRPKQLLRADWTVFDLKEGTLLLKDSKGRGGSRDHLLPLTSFALEQLKPLQELNALAPFPFTSDGKRRLALETLSNAISDVSKALKKSHGVSVFQLRDLRRTAETMLQRLGVDREVRAHLLSHGRTTGVQGKHYERWHFLPEKKQALEKWALELRRITEGKPAKVVKLKA